MIASAKRVDVAAGCGVQDDTAPTVQYLRGIYSSFDFEKALCGHRVIFDALLVQENYCITVSCCAITNTVSRGIQYEAHGCKPCLCVCGGGVTRAASFSRMVPGP